MPDKRFTSLNESRDLRHFELTTLSIAVRIDWPLFDHVVICCEMITTKASVDLEDHVIASEYPDTSNHVEIIGFSKGDSTLQLTDEMFYSDMGDYDVETSITTDDTIEKSSCTRDRLKGISLIFYKYGSRASLNGVPFIMESRQVLVKVMWSLLLAAAIGASIFHLFYLFSKYLEYQKYSQVSLHFDSLQFPAVTICNVNMMRMSQRKYAAREIQRLFQTSNDERPETKSAVNQTNATNDVNNKDDTGLDSENPDDTVSLPTSSTNSTTSNDDGEPDMSDPLLLEWVTEKEQALCEYCNYCWDQGQFKNSSLYEVDDYFAYLFNKQPIKLRERLGHQLSGMVRMCSFSGRMCGYSSFKRVVSPLYGNCYTIENKDFISRKSGPAGGLELILSLETEEYTPAITPGVGARVIIHEPGTAPFHDDNDMAVGPGLHTFIALKKVEINRMGSPFSPCVPENENIGNYKYSKAACQKACEQNHIESNCKCYDSELDQSSSSSSLSEDKNVTLSQCKKKEERLCLYKVRCDLETNKETCNCESPCRESVYEKTMATLQWPTDGYVDYIKPEICNDADAPAICRQNESNSAFRGELVKLNIYYEDLNYELLTDQPNYEMVNLLSDIGGSIGLWIVYVPYFKF
ncbi:hypothetical protein Btru_036272 [Bulinus truncatus]|nr:hypothetical protein Btru_036272 [Bulinus truncatus]